MPRRLSALLLFVCACLPATSVAAQFEQVIGYSTKTGFRAVFAWQADQSVAGIVEYSVDGGEARTARPLAGAPDTAQMAVVDGFEPGQRISYRIRDQLGGTTSAERTFVTGNAYTSWNGSAYTLNALVQLDSEALPDGIPWDQGLGDLAAGIRIMSERLYDAMDGYARMGMVLVTDTVLNYPLNVPFGATANLGKAGCAPMMMDGTGAVGPTVADFLVQTSIPFDSHTYGGWMIDNPCIGFYIGRVGQLVTPWQDDLHLGYVMTHELMHYAFNAPDLYSLNSDADCKNLDWDGSLMYNEGGWNGSRWELTELDRNESATPCNHGTQPYTWDALRERYVRVPGAATPQHIVDTAARGNTTGGALEIWVLDNNPAGSRLCRIGTQDCFESGTQ